MKNKLPGLATIALLAAGGAYAYRAYDQQRGATADSPAANEGASIVAAGATGRDTAGDQLLVRARNQLERRASVAARMRHQVSLDGHHLFGVGGYWQQGGGEELRVRLELQIANEATSLLQISNGRVLWTDRRLPVERSITQVNLRKVRYALSRETDDFDDLAAGSASWSKFEPDFSISYGGLPTLLATLSEQFAFLPPQAMRWTPTPQLAGLPESLPVFAVVGHWKADALAAIVPNAKDARDLPDRLPQEVLLLFGQSDLFPYRIEFRKLLHPIAAASAAPSPTSSDAPQVVPFQLSSNPLVVLELFEVSFDLPIAAGQFDYSPGDAKWVDRTDEHLEKLKLVREVRMAAKRAERR